MAQIVVKKESLVTLKGALETLKDEFNTSITDIKSNLLNISNNWEGKKADETLSVIETLNKTNSDLLIRINENIEYIQEVITTIDKVESVEVETKPVETPEPTIAPTPAPTPTPTPTIEPTVIPTSAPSQTTTLNNIPIISTTEKPIATVTSPIENSIVGATKITDELLTKLGVKRDSNGKPIKLGNMFVVTKTTNSYKNDYLLFLPTNSNGEIPADLPVFLEFHGNGLSKNHVNLGKTETGFPIERARDEMGLKFTRDNPNFQAIILMPQAENSGNTGNGSKIFNEIYNEVVDTFNTRTDGAIALTFSAGGASYYRYSKDYSKDIKAAYIIDPSTYVNLFQNVPPETPLTFFTSQRTGGDKDYSKLIIGAHKGLNRDLQVYNPILPSQENFQEEIIDILKDSKKPGSRFVNIPTTTHLQANQLVYDDYFYETLLKLWETP